VTHSSPHILAVEDDREISRLLAKYLSSNGYRVSIAENGAGMDRVLRTSRINLIVLDLMLPGEDGLSLCRRVRMNSRIPIIMLTAKREEMDRIIGLELGADDYLAKPFNPRELLARIRSVLRRSTSPSSGAGRRAVFTFAGWRLDCTARTLVDPVGTGIVLTSAEFELLRVLCERPNMTLSRDQLVDLTQGRAAGPLERSVDILISRIRKKIETEPHRPAMIQTIRSGGYVFTPAVQFE
jgi:two-component system OmpR family response regulator